MADLDAAIKRLGRASVLVVGDAMLDRWVYGDVARVSREAPVPVLCMQRELSVPGGAGNVVRNLGALGAAVAFVSVVGDDQAGADLTGLIGGQPGVEPWLLVQGGRATTLKTRFVAQGQQLLRADREDREPVHPRLAERLLRIARDAMAATTVTVLSDYRNGVLAGDQPAQLILAARQAGRRIIAHVHGTDYERYAGVDVLVPNHADLARATGIATDSDAGAAAAAAVLRERHSCGAVLVTRKEDGLTLVDALAVRHYRAEVGDVFDAAGEGDTIVATLSAALAAGVALPVAARLANVAAGVVDAKIGIAVARISDLQAALSPYGGALRKIVSREVAAERVERWRRRGWRTGFTHGSFDPLRPGHVHLIDQARAACDRLVVAVASDGSVRRRKGLDRPLRSEAVRAAELAGLPSVDLVVVHQGDTPAELLQVLRPELLVNGADRALDDVPGADLVRAWGGEVMLADLLPEVAIPAD